MLHQLRYNITRDVTPLIKNKSVPPPNNIIRNDETAQSSLSLCRVAQRSNR